MSSKRGSSDMKISAASLQYSFSFLASISLRDKLPSREWNYFLSLLITLSSRGPSAAMLQFWDGHCQTRDFKGRRNEQKRERLQQNTRLTGSARASGGAPPAAPAFPAAPAPSCSSGHEIRGHPGKYTKAAGQEYHHHLIKRTQRYQQARETKHIVKSKLLCTTAKKT